MIKKNISYFAVIPAVVRYDMSLSANAKLLYGEITALCNQEGYCWATTKYFMDLYGASKRSVINWINSLIEQGYIERKIKYAEDGKTILHRCISLPKAPKKKQLQCFEGDKNGATPIAEIDTTSCKKLHQGSKENCTTPSAENCTYNNTSINNTDNITPLSPLKGEKELLKELVEKNFGLFYENYPRKQGRKKAYEAFCRIFKNYSSKEKVVEKSKTILSGLFDSIGEWEKQGVEKRFTPLPATWLNGERWNDE